MQTHSASQALRAAHALPIADELVVGCLDLDDALDRRFALAWRNGLLALAPPLRSGALPGVTGHLAESVVEVMLADRGFVPLSHHPGPGRHGVDLLMLHLEAEMVLAIEVKGTLRPRRLLRMPSRELSQMTTDWVDDADNPGMTGAKRSSEDVFGAFAAVNLADMTLRMALTADFATYRPVTTAGDLDGPSVAACMT